jgi:indole-3-glycerol phosphate synthase
MTATYLDEILRRHRARAATDERNWRERVGQVNYVGPSMYEALANRSNANVRVIAEVKRRSPSRGWLNEYMNVADMAQAFVSGGAAAISVLTDDESFGGSAKDLGEVANAVRVPLLRKDFTVCANDVLDTAAMGASTVLLIVAALSDDELREFLVLAEACGIDALVEVHDREEATRALDAGARIVGVNQRNLRTFEVDPTHASSVVESLPDSVVSVCESGLGSVADVRHVAAAGFDAVLVGEAFVTSSAVEEMVRSFASVPWVGRG